MLMVAKSGKEGLEAIADSGSGLASTTGYQQTYWGKLSEGI